MNDVTLRRALSACVLAGSLALVLALAAGVGSAEAKSLVVGPGQSIQKAINAAHSGDVIRIAPGTYAGGVTIDKSVGLIGSGAGKTIIKGGGPVLTIGKAFARSEPKVTISKVKVTGGRTTSSPISKFYVDKKNVIALGAGSRSHPGSTSGIASPLAPR
jgi:nitrous oxidase accessory protein NosD